MLKNTFLLVFTFLSFSLSAQFTEVGIAGGVANYQGDLSPEISFQDLNIGITNGSVGILVRRNFNPFIGLRGALNYGKVAGDDRLSPPGSFKNNRNLRFETDIFEASAIAEWNIFGYDPAYGTKVFTPYLFAGVGGYYFNPKTDYNGRLVALQPLGTEGQGSPGYGKKYSLISLCIPVGGGLKAALGENWTVGIEFGARKIFHDYLDDVSGFYAPYEVVAERGEVAASVAYRGWELTDESPAASTPAGSGRGNDKFVDWYYFSVATLTYNLSGSGNGRRRIRGMNKSGCPTW